MGEHRVKPELFRPMLRQGLVASGFSETLAHETADIALHAVDRAMEALVGTTNLGSTPEVKLQANFIAVQLLADRAGTAHRKLSEAVDAAKIAVSRPIQVTQ